MPGSIRLHLSQHRLDGSRVRSFLRKRQHLPPAATNSKHCPPYQRTFLPGPSRSWAAIACRQIADCCRHLPYLAETRVPDIDVHSDMTAWALSALGKHLTPCEQTTLQKRQVESCVRAEHHPLGPEQRRGQAGSAGPPSSRVRGTCPRPGTGRLRVATHPEAEGSALSGTWFRAARG